MYNILRKHGLRIYKDTTINVCLTMAQRLKIVKIFETLGIREKLASSWPVISQPADTSQSQFLNVVMVSLYDIGMLVC